MVHRITCEQYKNELNSVLVSRQTLKTKSRKKARTERLRQYFEILSAQKKGIT